MPTTIKTTLLPVMFLMHDVVPPIIVTVILCIIMTYGIPRKSILQHSSAITAEFGKIDCSLVSCGPVEDLLNVATGLFAFQCQYPASVVWINLLVGIYQLLPC